MLWKPEEHGPRGLGWSTWRGLLPPLRQGLEPGPRAGAAERGGMVDEPDAREEDRALQIGRSGASGERKEAR